MFNVKEIKILEKEFNDLLTKVGIDNLTDSKIIEKSLELEKKLFEYYSKHKFNPRQMLY